MTPEEIARRLPMRLGATLKQFASHRYDALWPRQGVDSHGLAALSRIGAAQCEGAGYWRLTPLGQQMRAAVERETRDG